MGRPISRNVKLASIIIPIAVISAGVGVYFYYTTQLSAQSQGCKEEGYQIMSRLSELKGKKQSLFGVLDLGGELQSEFNRIQSDGFEWKNRCQYAMNYQDQQEFENSWNSVFNQ